MSAEVTVTSKGGSLTQEISAGPQNQHHLFADEPTGAGGEGRGPNPYELLLAALGSCTGITLQMYAKHKGLPLEGIKITLRHDRIHSQDCKDCESQDAFVDHLYRDIELVGPLSQDQRARLMVIATHCPVHKTLTHEIKIRDRLIGNGQSA